MKLWSYFDIPNWEDMRDRINQRWIDKYPQMKMLNYFPNHIIYDTVPDLKEWLDSQGITVSGFGIFVFQYNTTDSKVHVDIGNPTNYRFNIPLMDTDTSHTEFFDPIWDKGVDIQNLDATEDSPVREWEYGDEGALLDGFVLNKPAILHVRVPHRVRVTENKPRICLTACPVADSQLLRFL
jgi:hypothetical protein